MSERLAASLRAALQTPVGDRLEQVFHAPFVTVLLAERDGGEDAAAALEVARDALASRGVATGRQSVLLAATDSPDAAHRAAARALRAKLGLPVVLHDPARSPNMPAAIEEGLSFELDDELREAEAVFLVSALRPDAAFGQSGGEELLVPGAASTVTAAQCAAVAGDAAGRQRIARLARSVCRIDYALLWSAADPRNAWAGEPPAVVERAHAALGHTAGAGSADPV